MQYLIAPSRPLAKRNKRVQWSHMRVFTNIFVLTASLSASEPTSGQVAYWKARALNAEAAYNNCSSQTAQQRYQAEQAAKAMQDVQTAAAELDKSCLAKGGKPKRLEATNEPTCEDKKPEEKKPEAKKSDAGKPAASK